ncbi:MAG: shikimate dehydrogenase [Streptosporangiaceae bacterium]
MKAAVLGSPIAHSLSPVLHRAAYAAAGLDGWTYTAVECDEAGLPALIGGCGPDWAGLSLTMPLKRAVLPLLDHVDPLAADVGGANTVVFAAGGRLGYNTDIAGMVAALAEAGLVEAGSTGADPARAKPAAADLAGLGRAGPGWAGPGSAVILGAGATACSALAALRAVGLRTVTVAVRDESRADALRSVAQRLGVRVQLRSLAAPAPATDLLISTVPAGAADSYAERICSGPAPAAVFDVVYAPWPTPLARAAAAAGATVIGGFELLVQQAAGQFELMTGRHPAPVAAMRAAGLAELDRRAQAPAAPRRPARMPGPPDPGEG